MIHTYTSSIFTATVDTGDPMSVTIHASPSALALAIACGVLVLWILLTRRGRR